MWSISKMIYEANTEVNVARYASAILNETNLLSYYAMSVDTLRDIIDSLPEGTIPNEFFGKGVIEYQMYDWATKFNWEGNND